MPPSVQVRPDSVPQGCTEEEKGSNCYNISFLMSVNKYLKWYWPLKESIKEAQQVTLQVRLFLQLSQHPNVNLAPPSSQNGLCAWDFAERETKAQMASVEGPALSDWHTGTVDCKSFPP